MSYICPVRVSQLQFQTNMLILIVSFLLFLTPSISPSQIATIPDCKKVCSHMYEFKQPNFTMSIWNVNCQDMVCVLKSKRYSKYQIPKKPADEHMVHTTPIVDFDLRLLKLTGVNFKEDTVDIGLWVGMEWEDPNLSMCNCKDEESEYEVDMDLEGKIWMPDMALYSWKKIERMNILSPNKQFLVQKRNDTIKIYFSVDLRSTVMCPFNPTFYPYDRNICYVRIGSYSHNSAMLQFRRHSFSYANIIYKDIKVYPRALCNEEAWVGVEKDGSLKTMDDSLLDGFKIILNREGKTMKDMYVFTMHLFLITAGLASLLPSHPPEGLEVDKSGPIIEVVISSYYILFDLITQTPIDNLGKNMLIEFVRISNNFVYSTVVIYFSILYVRRFGKSTFQVARYVFKYVVSGFSRVGSCVRGEVNEVVKSEENRDIEEDNEGIRRGDKAESVIDIICYIANKTYFMVLVLVYWGFSNQYWLKNEMMAISIMHHNRATGDTCTCTQKCQESHGGH